MGRLISELKIIYYSALSYFLNWKKIRVVLVIGTGRTGTEFLADYVTANSDGKILSYHEPMPDLLNLAVAIRKYNLKKNKIALGLFKSRLSQLKQCKRKNVKLYFESNNNFSFFLPYLNFLFKNVKILYFTRNPEDFLLSEMNKKHGRKKFHVFSESDTRERINPVLLREKPTASLWNKWPREYKIVWHWKYCNEYILKYLNNYEHKRVKYEDFFSSDRTIKKEVLNFIGFDNHDLDMDFFKKKRNASKESDYSSLADFDSEFRNHFVKATKELKQKLAY